MKGSIEERRMYLFRCNFSSCSESAEIWHADSFYVKKCPCVFFHKRENKASNTFLKVHPPPPSPPPSPSPLPPPPPPLPSNSVKHTLTVFWLSGIEILRCLDTDRGTGVGGGERFCTYFFAFLKKGTFFNTKRVSMPNFIGVQATWKIAAK